MIKAVILDMTETIHTLNKNKMLKEFKNKLWKKYFSEVNFSEFKNAYFQAYSHYQVGLIKNDRSFFKDISKSTGIKLTEKKIKELIKLHMDLRIHFIRLMPGLIPTLEYLKKKKYKLAMVSNCVRTWADYDFKRMKFNQKKYFPVSISSQDVHYLKPNPRIFKACFKKLKVKPEECVYVGDDILDINGAKYSGIKVRILFEKPAQVCHYVEYTGVEKKPVTADYKIKKLAELKKIL